MIYNYIFFHYSFDEHIKYDLPAMLNYALEVSGQDQLSYVGHSQGTAMGFGGFSSMPELAVKATLFVALAPVANVTYVKGTFRILAEHYKEEKVWIPCLVYHLNIDYYEHLDFIWGLDSGYAISPRVVAQLKAATGLA